MSLTLSALFVNFNSWRLLDRALRSLCAAPPHGPDGQRLTLEVIVVDNASPLRDAAAEAELRGLVAAIGGVFEQSPDNGGYAAGMNRALAHARGELILVCNPDLLFLSGTVDRLVAALCADATVGAAQPEQYWDEDLQCRLPAGHLPTLRELYRSVLAPLWPRAARRHVAERTQAMIEVWTAPGVHELRMLSGCCFLMRRATISRVGFFDAGFPLYYEDTDLGKRIQRAGLRIVQVGGSRVVHLYNRSAVTAQGVATERFQVGRRRYFARWHGWLGRASVRLVDRLHRTALVRRRLQRLPWPVVVDCPVVDGRPLLQLPRRVERFLVEHANDQWFTLTAGTFGSGDTWSPRASLYANYPATVYFRVVDLSAPGGRLLGIYRHRRTLPAEATR
ncbi:MAG: glycosyltransferase [Planctomycetes bacterium]|nr:glycosyltransferase [Planctomycetota bacterium]